MTKFNVPVFIGSHVMVAEDEIRVAVNFGGAGLVENLLDVRVPVISPLSLFLANTVK